MAKIDTSAPSGGSISYTNGYFTTTSVQITLSDVTDSGSGIGTKTLQRKSATLSNGSCGSFSSFNTIASNPTSPYNDTSVSNGYCYMYQYIVSDNAGNSVTYTSPNVAKIDTSLPSDITTVNDGTGADIDYQTSTTQISGNWTASTDAQSGVAKYWYCVGTVNNTTTCDTVGWTDNDTSTSVTKTVSLTNGQIYYFKVKAENGAGLPSSVSKSDGVTVDTSLPPAPSPVNDGASSPDIDYQQLLTQLSCNWGTVTGAVKYWYCIGTVNDTATCNTVGWTDNGASTSVTKSSLVLNSGTTYYCKVKGENGVGTQGYVGVSDGVIPDNTNPTDISTVNDGTGADIDYQTSTTQISGNWTASSDAQSGIAKYWYCVGTLNDLTTCDTVGWTDNSTATSVTKTGLTLANGQIYYFKVKAENGAGGQSNVSKSDGVTVDNTNPTDIATVNDGASPPDIDYQQLLTQLSANWTASTDTQSNIAKYWYCVGTVNNTTTCDTVNWTDNSTATSVTKTGLTLANGQTYYFKVKAENGAGGQSNVSVSDGVTVDNNGPTDIATVNDGLSADITYTTSSTQLSANWTASSDAQSGVAKYWYCVGTVNNTTTCDTVGWTDNSTATSVTKTGLTLTNGQIYYFKVKAENGAGLLSNVTKSNGQKVDTTSPTIPIVTAPEYSTSSTQISFSWTVSSDNESGIAKYWYCIGTTYGGCETINWTDNGLTTSITKTSLTLNNTRYYVCAKAENGAGLSSYDCGSTLIDTTPPTTTFNNPPASETKYSNFPIDITDSDTGSGLATCEYKVVSNGVETKPWTSRTCNSTTSTTITVGTTGDCKDEGTDKCEIFVRATDNAGNSNGSSSTISRKFSINWSIHTITFNNPQDASWQKIDFPIDIADSGSNLTCEYKVVSNGVTTKDWTSRTCNSTTSTTITVGTTGDCKNEGISVCTITVRSTDISGEILTATRTFSIDWTQPAITLSLTPNNSIINGTITVTANATDATSGVKNVVFYNNGTSLYDDSEMPYSTTIDTSNLTENINYAITAKAIDNATNDNTVGNSPSSFKVDRTLPTAIISTPANLTEIAAKSVAISGTAKDTNTNFDNYILSIFDGTNLIYSSTGTTEIDNNKLCDWDASAVASGSYCLKLEVKDKASNFGYAPSTNNDGITWNSSGLCITVDNTPPATTSDLSASNITGTSAILQWTAPGDDGTTGKATSYDVKCYTSALNDLNWLGKDTNGNSLPATDFIDPSGESAPNVAGTGETFTVNGLTPGKTYYCALKTKDNVGNESEISNNTSSINTPNNATLNITGTSLIASPDANSVLPKVALGATKFPVEKIDLSASVQTAYISSIKINSTGTSDTDINTVYIYEASSSDKTVTANAKLIASGSYASGIYTVTGLNYTVTPGTSKYLIIAYDINSKATIRNKTGLKVDNGNITANIDLAGLPIESNKAEIENDTTSPNPITECSICGKSPTTLKLCWTTTGDDGNTGTATSYDIRHLKNEALNDTNWASAIIDKNLPTPFTAGNLQDYTVTGLQPDTTYYMGIKAIDDAGNNSTIASCGSGITEPSDTQAPTIKASWPSNAEPGKDLIVSANITDNDNVSAVSLVYTVGSTTNAVSMILDEGSASYYTGKISGSIIPNTGDIYLTIKASDPSGNTGISGPQTVPIADTNGPIITHTPVQNATKGYAVTIIAMVTDASGISNVQVCDKALNCFDLSVSSGSTYTGTIPKEFVVSGLEYYITAKDKKNNPTTTDTYKVIVNDTGIDENPPTITDHTVKTAIQENNAITINADITDDVGLKTVSICYRRKGEPDYNCLLDLSITDGSQYKLATAEIPSDKVIAGVLEYYIKATDTTYQDEITTPKNFKTVQDEISITKKNESVITCDIISPKPDPGIGNPLRDEIYITGVARTSNESDFSKYYLQYKGANEKEWTDITIPKQCTSTTPTSATGTQLCVWDTKPDDSQKDIKAGKYTIKLICESNGNTQQEDTVDIIVNNEPKLTHPLPPVKVKQWALVSVPMLPSVTNITPETVFQNTSGKPLTDLKVYEWDPTINESNKWKKSTEITDGKAYMISYTPADNVNGDDILIPGYLKSQTDAMRITLKQGWNLIGHSFINPILWGTGQVKVCIKGTTNCYNINNQPDDWKSVNEIKYVSKYLWTYDYASCKEKNDCFTRYTYDDGTGLNSTSMQPFIGYLVYTRAEVDLLITPPDLSKKLTTSTKNRYLLPFATWHIKFDAYNDITGDSAEVGVAQSSNNNIDDDDALEPPKMSNFISAYFLHNDWGKYNGYYTVDFRSKDQDTYEWFMDVITDLQNENINLTWEQLLEVPKEYDIKLIDLATKKELNLRTEKSYVYNSGDGGIRHFKVIVSKNSSDKNLSINEGLSLNSVVNLPNPIDYTSGKGLGLSNATTFKYKLSSDVIRLDIEIFNTKGKLIEKLNGELDGDTTWNGASQLPNGIYIYRLVAYNIKGEQVSVVKKLVVLR